MSAAQFSLKFDLETVAAVSFSAKAWDRPDIKNKIKDYFLSEDPPSHENWCEVSEIILLQMNSLPLPTRLLLDLKYTVVGMGEKIRDWIHHVTRVFKFEPFFEGKIFWTPHGTIDEIKIFNSYWVKNRFHKCDKSKPNLFNLPPVYFLACAYAEVKFIDEHSKNIFEGLPVEIWKRKYRAYSIINFILNSTLKEVLKKRGFWKEGYERRDETIVMCLKAGFIHAFKLYWNLLDQTQRNVSDFAEIVLKDHDSVLNESKFVNSQYCEIFLFLINQMEEEERRKFLKETSQEIIERFLPVWPYQELIIQFFDYDWPRDNNNIPNRLLRLFLDCHENSKSGSKIYFPVFKMIWKKLTAHEKMYFLLLNVKKLFFENFDVLMLDLVLNDADVDNNRDIFDSLRREEMLFFERKDFMKVTDIIAYHGCSKLIEHGNFDKIALIEELDLFAAKKSFKENYLSTVNNVVIKGEVKNADKFLDWISDSSQEMEALKGAIDVLSLTNNLIAERKFKLADKFLNWISDLSPYK